MALIAPRRDRRAVGYAGLAIGFAILALLRGEPSDLALAAPFAVVVALGLRQVRPIEVSGKIHFETVSSFEGDEVRGTIELIRPAGLVATMSVDNRPGWTAVDPGPALVWTLPPGGSKVVAHFTVRAESWGRHRLGAVNVSFRRPYGLTVWESSNDNSPSFNVLPTPEHVRQLLPPPASQSAAGVHISRLVGEGFDFAELRPYVAGDRLRDVNWRASARFEQLQTNRRHPDRSGELVLLLDTFVDGVGTASATSQAALARAARAAWSIAQLHLNVQDRVGLATQGRVVTQLRPRSGDRARYELLQTLLTVGGMVTAGESAVSRHRLNRLPAGALLIAFTPLLDQRFAIDLLALHRAGRPVMAVVVELVDLLPPTTNQAEALARRIFQLGIDEWREDLVSAGVPLARWTGDADLTGVLGALNRLHRTVRVSR
ncbi:MAG: hypothetical protein JWM12_3976 [Ilumatobacteraceae bacterium]|nr:hypothetical protein [Ilumatobacteraceae bacterium]